MDRFSQRRTRLWVDSRCALFPIQIPRISYLCLAYHPGKPPRFGPNVSPRANDLILPSRSSASRSTARRRPSPSGNVNSLRSPNQASFCLCWPSEPTKDSIESKLPEAGERRETIGVREQPLTTDHLPHMSPSGRLEVLGVRLSPAAYARRQFLCRPPG